MAKGTDFIIYVEDKALPGTFIKVAGQRNGTINREYDTVDVTNKDNAGWSDEEYGVGRWSIEGDGLLVENDAGYLALEEAFENAEYVKVRFQTAEGNKYEGNALISDFPIEAPYDDAATYSITLNGKGAYTKTAAV
jgi:TP901-1 family phage major tail protein